MNHIMRIMRKEFSGFFASPVAFIFFGAFLAVTLFIFFWVETFFNRNIADVRPLFEWMPVLLIFLVSSITMRMWSEERRSGTLEFLLTAPVQPLQLVLGKFAACLALVAVTLVLTLPLAITVSFIGNIDWGPVFGGYMAALFLAAAYISIGLYISARSENQIISLIVTTVVCSVFYLIGSDALTNMFDNELSQFMKLLGSGSRFDSITRGVIDFRDIYYYLSLVGIFLALNVYALERQRWAGNKGNTHHRQWGLATTLLCVNFIMFNAVLQPVHALRADFTEGQQYSISESTHGYLAQLKEPLLIRGYFSAQTHPLLAPLVPRIHDLLEEYAIAGGDKIQVEFIDPLENPELEREAAEKYQIRPMPFQMASKYQASVVNSYFDLVIKYGDQYEKLSFRDLIEVKSQNDTDLDVNLRNPEYDITSAIKKVLYSYQSSGELFDNISSPVTFNGYISSDEQLPANLITMRDELIALLEEVQGASGNKFKFEMADPEVHGGALASHLEQKFGFRPMAANLFSSKTFWFYMTLASGDQLVQIPLPQNLNKEGLRKSIDAGLKRFSQGFLKNIAIVTPEAPASDPQGRQQPLEKQFNHLEDLLSDGHTISNITLRTGRIPDTADLLLLLSPENLDLKELFAVDQFLMQGGSVIIASGGFDVENKGVLTAKRTNSGLDEWLQHHGLTVEKTMVLDPQNAKFPVPIQRAVGAMRVQEMRMLEYPYFVDIRKDGMNEASGITSGLEQVTLNWASPITISTEKTRTLKVTKILESSPGSWTSDSTVMQPDTRRHGELGFAVGDETSRSLLGVVLEGQFTSYFKDKESPRAGAKISLDKDKLKDKLQMDMTDESISRIIGKSPESARIILMPSNFFLTDGALDLASTTLGTRYMNPAQLVANAVDWSLEDRGLLSIRGRSHFSRTLLPMDRDQQMFWEYLNYALALFGLFVVWLIRKQNHKRAHVRFEKLLTEEG